MTQNDGLMQLNIFYCWQSDTPPKQNRNFIEDCIKSAIGKIKKDNNIADEFIPDKVTNGRRGSPGIANEIFAKIAISNIVIADVTIINSANKLSKHTPNPNVLTELGYAAGKLGWENLILVCNEVYGKRQQ